MYQNPVLVWSDAVQPSPRKALAHNKLSDPEALGGNWEQAIEEFRVALAPNPDCHLAQESLRNAYLFHVGRAE